MAPIAAAWALVAAIRLEQRLTHLIGTLAQPPVNLLRRVRWIFLLSCLLLLLMLLPFLIFLARHQPAMALAGGTAALLLGGLWWWQYTRDGAMNHLWNLLCGVLLFVLGAALGPFPVLGIFYVGLYYQALQGTARRTGVITLVYLAAYAGATILAPGRQALENVLLQASVFPLSALTMAFVRFSLVKHEHAVGRERLLHRAGNELLGAASIAQVCQTMLDGFRELLVAMPGARVYVGLGDETAVQVVAAAGDQAASVVGTTVAVSDLPPSVRDALLAGEPREVPNGRPTPRTEGPNGPRHSFLVYPLHMKGMLRGAIAIISPRSSPRESKDAIAVLSSQALLALHRVLLEEDLRRNEVRFRSLVQHSTDVIAVIDGGGVLTYVSPSVEGILGRPPDDLSGRSVVELLHPDDARNATVLLESLRSRRATSMTAQFRLPHRDGGWRVLEWTATNRLDDPAVGGIVVNGRDVTERQRAEQERLRRIEEQRAKEHAEARAAQLQALAETRALYEAVAVNLADGLAIMDRHDTVVFWNPQMAALFDVESASATGQNLLSVQQRLPTLADDTGPLRHRVEAARVAALTGETTAFDYHLEGRRPRDLAILVFPIRGPHDLLGYGWLVRDVTRDRELERLKDELVGVVSHELRTPLASLVGFAELLLARELPEAQRRQYLETMLQEGHRLSSLVDEFLDLQRMEGGHVPINSRSCNVPALVARAVRAAGDDPDHPLHVDVPSDLPTIIGDADRLLQVFANLISNARKYSPYGGAVNIAARDLDGAVEIAVTDHGLGIPPDALPRLFQRFYRVDNSDSRMIKGTGLGLAISRKIIDAHGGRIWAESAGDGQGATFRFTIRTAPLSRASVPTRDGPSRADGQHAPDPVARASVRPSSEAPYVAATGR